MTSEVQTPMCDSDIIVKVAKVDKANQLYKVYGNIHYADAVYQEICHNCTTSNPDKKHIKPYFEMAKDIITNQFCNSSHIVKLSDVDSRKREVIKSKLRAKGILYNCNTGKFALADDCGETVSIVYANILGYTLFLSDDNKCKTEIRRSSRLKWVHLRDVFKSIGVDISELEDEIFVANSENPKATRNYLDKVNNRKPLDLLDLKIMNEYKKRHPSGRSRAN